MQLHTINHKRAVKSRCAILMKEKKLFSKFVEHEDVMDGERAQQALFTSTTRRLIRRHMLCGVSSRFKLISVIFWVIFLSSKSKLNFSFVKSSWKHLMMIHALHNRRYSSSLISLLFFRFAPDVPGSALRAKLNYLIAEWDPDLALQFPKLSHKSELFRFASKHEKLMFACRRNWSLQFGDMTDGRGNGSSMWKYFYSGSSTASWCATQAKN